MGLKEKIKRIAEHYGYSKQKMIAIEELSELTKAICKLERADVDKPEYVERFKDVLEEIADVEIMIIQLIHLMNCDEKVEQIISEKVERQLERMKNE